MLTTVSSNKSLVVWKRNENRSELGVTWTPDGQAFIKPFYSGLFRSVAAKLVSGRYASFSRVFSAECDNACRLLKIRMSGLLKAAGADVTGERLEKVAVKFRGNAGEILVEKLAREGYFAKWFKVSKYDPVDPDDERFVDAESLCAEDGMPAGIQIKNYASTTPVKAETFVKAAATHTLWSFGRVEPAALRDYFSTPRQFVLSIASECADDRVLAEYGRAVCFVGPKDFDGFELQGGKRKPNVRLFEEIADEVDAFKV